MSALKTFKFTPKAYEDFSELKKQEPKLALRIKKLVQDILEHPFNGLGKPEPLMYNLSGCWSRRINAQHRLVYRIKDDELEILACRYHYQK